MSYQDGYDEGILYCLDALSEILYDFEGTQAELLEELTKLQLELTNIYNKEK